MGAHSTFEDHLKGVQAFHAPLTHDEQDGRHAKSSKGLKNSKSSRHKESSKHKREKKKDRTKEKKSKQKKEKKRRDDSDTEPSSSDDDVDTQLEKGRAAVRITREILERQISLKQELRQVSLVLTSLHVVDRDTCCTCLSWLSYALCLEQCAVLDVTPSLCSCSGALIRERPSR